MFPNNDLQSQPQPQQQQQHSFHLPEECQTSENAAGASPSSNGGSTSVTTQKPIFGRDIDGTTIEVIRRPRGRPRGSKNRPKLPLIITREPEPQTNPYVLEVPSGNDVVQAIVRFSNRMNTGLFVLKASGTVANVTLRLPVQTVRCYEQFEILSMSAIFLKPGTSPSVPNFISITLIGPHGQVVGGTVAGRLLAAGPVFIFATSFDNPSYHRLPSEEERRNNSISGGGDLQLPPVSGGGAVSRNIQADSVMYGGHPPLEANWPQLAIPF